MSPISWQRRGSSGCLNGLNGTLVFDKTGKKVLTFLPNAGGSGRTIVVAEATPQQIMDLTGARYAVTADTSAYHNNEEQAWSKVCS